MLDKTMSFQILFFAMLKVSGAEYSHMWIVNKIKDDFIWS